MKKFLSVLVILSVVFTSVFAQNSAVSANRNTALRCLKLAQNCLVGGEWENAVKQAELGLAYDNSISDLVYIKAAAQINLGKNRSEIIDLVNLSFEKNNWIGYTQNGARILLADLLSDTGKYEDSMGILDAEPFIYSADAEFIRIKNFYRIGTAESINNARLKVNSTRRIYPKDVRFPEIFFLFETMFLNKAENDGLEYVIPEIVKNISNTYIAKLPDYTGKNPQMELQASLFANDDDKVRLVNAIDAKDQTVNPLLAIAGLKVGLYNDQQAYDLFFSSVDEAISLSLLENLFKNIKDGDVQQQIIEYINNFTGTIIIDENLDLQNELTVEYELGRPKSIKYDRNNDGVMDIYSTCDMGAPMFVYFYDTKTEVFYDNYPNVTKVTFVDDNYDFNFSYGDYSFVPYNLVMDSTFEELGLEFYVPEMSKEIAIPVESGLLLKSSSVCLPLTERENATIEFTIENGDLVFANYFENERKYAYCDFTVGIPFVRYVDYDNDGNFETSEIFDLIPTEEGYDFEKETELIHKIFTKAMVMRPFYLKKVMIDRNRNTNYEFSEQYIEYNGKIILWDNDDNGICDCQYIRYPQKDGESLIEETIYFEDSGIQKIVLTTIDGIPVKMMSGENEVMIYAGSSENIYWIENVGSVEHEEDILRYAKNNVTQGAIDIIQSKDDRISVIKVNKNFFCRILPESELPEDTEVSE